MSLRLGELVPELLRQRPDKRLTARDIARLVVQAKPEDARAKRERAGHNEDEALNQLVAEIGRGRHTAQRRHPEFTWYDDSPRKFAWVAGTEEEKLAEAEKEAEAVTHEGLPAASAPNADEASLYPMLGNWLFAENGIYSMRIEETRVPSGAPRGPKWNKWRFPDVVGVQDLRDGWHKDIRSFANLHGAPRCRLWSFEVKLLVNRANLRDYYLQAVANSSWANRGYLVAPRISRDDNTRDELKILADTHGIGVIELDTEDVSNSRILIQARERDAIDWAACERLFSASLDFQRFLTKVLRLYQTDELPTQGWLVNADESD